MANVNTGSYLHILYYEKRKWIKGTHAASLLFTPVKSKYSGSNREFRKQRYFEKFFDVGLFQSSLSPPNTAVGTVFCSSGTSVKAISTTMFMNKTCIHECLNQDQMFLLKMGLLCVSLTIRSLVFIIFILIIIINVNLIRVGLF